MRGPLRGCVRRGPAGGWGPTVGTRYTLPMQLTLALVCCGPQLEVALAGGPLDVPSLVRLAGVSPRSTLLLAAADLLCEDAGVGAGALERVVVSRGPGSFTGIRAGLATAEGLAAASGVQISAFDSLTVQAARCAATSLVWAAQPGRRGEAYVRPFRIEDDGRPVAVGEVEILPVGGLGDLETVVAAESLALAGAGRAATVRSAAEALILLAELGVAADPLEPLYVEGPPVDGWPG